MARRVIVAALLVAVVAPSGGAAILRSGLYGVVRRGPTQPVCRVDEPCSAPAQVTLVFSRRGHASLRTQSNADGIYKIRLPAGRYVVRTTEKVFGRIPEPRAATVPRARFARIDFSIDTGIR
jgi:hypothetical protein